MCRSGGWRCSSNRASIDGTQWVVFEPNDETLGPDPAQRRRIHAGLFLQGAFQGTTPQQAYFVKCDAENNRSRASTWAS